MLRLTREQVREIDRRATEDFHIPAIVLMENAARSATDVAMQMLAGIESPAVLIVCGSGNNGGDGLAIARHLHNRGVQVEVVRDCSDDLKGDAAINLRIIKAMPLETRALEEGVSYLHGVHLGIDAMFGTGLTRPIGPEFAHIIEQMNARTDAQVLAIDVPSGLDCNTGEPLGDLCVRADRTVTFAAEKAGFANPASKQFTGEITVGCIGCPRELIEQVAKMTPT
jgi:NAD(P)H-hydrate epimerase